MKKEILRVLKGKQKSISIASVILNIIATLTLILWLVNLKFDFLGVEIDLEALFVLLTTTAIFLNQLHRWLLAEAEYSPAYALALGYVNNFIEPAITQLIEDGINKPILYIYKPDGISELYKSNIDRAKASIINNSFELSEIQLGLKHGRARDILTIQKSKTKKIYFDFPNTLLSLSAYIDFKIISKENESFDNKKKELTTLLLDKFYSKVDELIVEKDIQEYVKYCNKNLIFNF